MMKPLIILTGPTAVGKTALSVRLAKAVGGEIISADSMQVYRHMDIGSAKVTREEMDGVPHYLIDILEPAGEFNVAAFKKLASEAVEEIYAHGHLPIVVGGTGFYIQALLYDIDFTEQGEEREIREELERLGEERGAVFLHDMLAEIDPEAAMEIHANNRKRVIRAIEFYRQTGERISEHNKRERQKRSPYDFLYYVLTDDRKTLYERIDQRVDAMVEAGLVGEVEKLMEMGCTKEMVSMQGLGYKEILDYLQGNTSLDEAVTILKRDTRHFAKRQITWFKRERDVRKTSAATEKRSWRKCFRISEKRMDWRQKIMEMDAMYEQLGIERKVLEFGKEIEGLLSERFAAIDETAEYNQLKVIKAMQDNRVSDIHFAATTGYGYNDLGRDTLEDVYASVFHTESALVRPNLISGTHALHVALSGNLRPGDELLSPVGKPYDTLEEVIGIRESAGSLKEYGVIYRQVDLLPDGSFDFDGIAAAVNEKTKLVTIQRSKGYATRPTLSVERIGQLIAFIKERKPDVICMVDNCYGEFVERMEPADVGADMMVGSLIKNPGGGLAPIGGYIAGRKDCIDRASYRLTAPGLGREVGASLGLNQSFYQGLFLAPTVVAGALKGAVFAANVYEKLGFSVVPNSTESRHDIIQAVTFGKPEGVIAFCQGIQAAAPVDSFVTPEPWAMPGYDAPVIMAAGAFVQGASIELSADGPIKPPYAVYFQGGLTWYHAKLGILMSMQKLKDAGLITL